MLDRVAWAVLERQGAAVDACRGDADDPLGGVVHVLLADSTDVDVVVAKWKWQAQVIARAEAVSISGALVRVPGTSDLILLKLAAGDTSTCGTQPLSWRSGTDPRWWRRWTHVREIHPDVQAQWRELLAAVDE